jgi:hypothetical protein
MWILVLVPFNNNNKLKLDLIFRTNFGTGIPSGTR